MQSSFVFVCQLCFWCFHISPKRFCLIFSLKFQNRELYISYYNSTKKIFFLKCFIFHACEKNYLFFSFQKIHQYSELGLSEQFFNYILIMLRCNCQRRVTKTFIDIGAQNLAWKYKSKKLFSKCQIYVKNSKNKNLLVFIFTYKITKYKIN